MCGICGFLASDGRVGDAAARVLRATELLHHRGPDGSGVHVDGPVALGHTRLSIIDVEHGGQPLFNEDRSVATVFNGEIWNHVALREELVQLGHVFSTRADTEVLVHGYEEWGRDLPRHLDGMFAFALWDSRSRTALLARDRLGKKPLYVHEAPDGIAFGSDCRSALVAAGASPRLNDTLVPQLLFQRYTVAPDTMFTGVVRLEPGHAVELRDTGESTTWAYWSPREATSDGVSSADVRGLLLDAVSKRLMSDVPVGALLSGGVDSGAIVGLAAEAGATEFHTFTIGFDDARYDERPLARLTAERYGTLHHELAVTTADFVEALPRLSWFRDEPIAEPSEIPLLLLAELAGRHVKVVLTGDGGDELFGGYPKYRAERIARVGAALPEAVLAGAGALASRLPTHRRLGRAFETLAVREESSRWASWFRTFSAAELGELLVSAPAYDAGAALRRVLGPYADIDPQRRMLIGDLLTYLPDNMLARGDKVLMAASVEGRTPLLDLRLVERLALSSARERAGLTTGKRILRQAIRDLLPAEVMDGRKRGFRSRSQSSSSAPAPTASGRCCFRTEPSTAASCAPKLCARWSTARRNSASAT